MTEDAPLLVPAAIALIRERRPLIHMITNLVSMAACAQSVKAIGASTLFAHDTHEAVEAAGAADAVVINIGTSVPGIADTVLEVAEYCRAVGTPVVLDPVGVGATSYRRGLTADLMATGALTVVSGNAAELACIMGVEAHARGADSVSTTLPAARIASSAAEVHRTVAAVSGVVDFLGFDGTLVAVGNGHPIMGQVVGTGSARSVLLGAFLAVATDWPLQAATTGVCAFGLAGEHAAALGHGPGYFLADLYNALAALDDETLAAQARVRIAERTS